MGHSQSFFKTKSADAPWYMPNNVREIHNSLLTALHFIGNAESGASFEIKTRFIRNLLQNACPSFPRGVEFFYLTAPHRIQPASSITRAGGKVTPETGEFDAWTWGFGDYMTEVMQG